MGCNPSGRPPWAGSEPKPRRKDFDSTRPKKEESEPPRKREKANNPHFFSPLFPPQELLQQGCVFQERHGWERPGWFNPQSEAPVSIGEGGGAGPAQTLGFNIEMLEEQNGKAVWLPLPQPRPTGCLCPSRPRTSPLPSDSDVVLCRFWIMTFTARTATNPIRTTPMASCCRRSTLLISRHTTKL